MRPRGPGNEDGFEKEATLLNCTKGHRNIIRFLEFSIVMEYSCFDFHPFGVAKSLCTLLRRFCPFRRL